PVVILLHLVARRQPPRVRLQKLTVAAAAGAGRDWGMRPRMRAQPFRIPGRVPRAAVRPAGKAPCTMPGSRPPRWECLGIPVRTQYVLLAEKSVLPEVAPYLKIKFPTADSGRGLGTGEFDETVGVDLSKTLFPRFVSYVTLAYTFIGSP